MTLITDQILEHVLTQGRIPSELIEVDVDKKMAEEWESLLDNLGLTPWDPEGARNYWAEAGDQEKVVDVFRWLGAVQRACQVQTHFLFMLPLGARNYGRGDQDGEAVFTLFFEAAGVVYRICVYTMNGAPSDGAYTFQPHTLATILQAESGAPLFRSFTAFKWQVLYGDRDPDAATTYSASRSFRADYGPVGIKFDAGPPMKWRANEEEAQLDLLQIQAQALASVALFVGSHGVNARRDQVNDILWDLKDQLRRVIAETV